MASSLNSTLSVPQDSALLNLPAELRLQIYSYLLPNSPLSISHLLSQYCSHNTWISPPLSRTCSLLRNETLPLHYNLNTFTYDLRSPLDDGVTCLNKALAWLRQNRCGKLGKLKFKHVNKGILSMQELRKWTELFIEYSDILPPSSSISFCTQNLRYRNFALQAAVALKSLIVFASSINKSIIGSGEEKELEAWIAEELEKTDEGKAVVRGVRVAEEFVKGFGAAAGGEVQGVNVLRWALMSGGMIEGLKYT